MLLQLLLSLVLVLVGRILWRRWRYDLHRVPSPPGLPLLGNTLDFVYGQAREQAWLWFRNCFVKLGCPKLIRVDMIGQSLLIVNDSPFIKDVMHNKTNPFPRHITPVMPLIPVSAFLSSANLISVVQMIGNDPTAKSLILTPSPTTYVKAFRRIFSTAFTNSNLTKLMPKINATLDRVMDLLETKRLTGPIDFQDLCSKMTLDVIGALVFDLNLGGLDGSRPLHGLLRETSDIGRANFSIPLLKQYCELFPWTTEGKRQSAAIHSINAQWDKIIAEIQKKGEPEDGMQPLWWLLKQLKDPDTNKSLDPKSLRTEVAFVVVAGMDGTGHQLAWIMSLLASHPAAVDSLLKELKEHGLEDESKEVSFQDLGNLSYLNAIVKEGMRLAYILNGSMTRYVPKDMDILGYRIPKGTLIETAGTRSVNFESEWGDPAVFRPERWLTEEGVSSNYSMGFAVGPRDCVGQRLALLELRLTVLRLVRRYHLELHGDIQELLDRAVVGLVTKSKNGIWIRPSPRAVAEKP